MRKLLFFLTVLISSCSKQGLPSPTLPSGQPAGPTAGTLAYLALGDSYTIGEGVTNADRWPVQLAELARQRNVSLAEPEIIARTGWTTQDLSTAIASARLTKTYDLVSLLIGVNNQYRGQSVAVYRTEFQQLLRTALTLAGNRPQRVMVLSIPDWGQSPFASGQNRTRIGAEIDQFNAAAKQECQSLGIAFIDITPLSRAAAGDETQFARDGLHYSGVQMRRWAQLVLPTVEAVLK